MHQDHTEVKVMLALVLPLVEIRPGYYGNLVVKLLDMLTTLLVYSIFAVLYEFFTMTVLISANPDCFLNSGIPGWISFRQSLGGIFKWGQRKGWIHPSHRTPRIIGSFLVAPAGSRSHATPRTYTPNAGEMKDGAFQMSPTKANTVNVIDCAVIAAERLQ